MQFVFSGNNDKAISELSVQKSSIDNVYQPLPALQETETIKSTLTKVRNKHKIMLHCYGVPGSGKSQLVRTLAKTFPYETDGRNSLYIKWHIRCKDTGDDLQKEFQHLAEKLQEHYFARTDDVRQNIKKEFGKSQANKFLEMLLNCKVPVLIVLEDPPQKDQDLLRDLFQRLDKDFQENNHSPFHVYVTSRIKSPIIAPKMSQHLEGYEVINVVGFNQEEGISFLEKFEGEAKESKEDLIKVFKRFSGMPLGMLAAKGYCQYTGINYKKYLILTEDNDYDILSNEKKAILQEYGQSAEHIFQAVVMPFMPEEESTGSSADLDLHWQVLCCISNFHYDRLPKFLIEACCHVIREQEVKNPVLRNEVDTGILVRKLVEHGMCTKAENGQFITFHEVVLNAFRFKAQSVHNLNLVKAMEAMCNLVSIDMREKEHFDKMCTLRPHLQALLLQVKRNETMLENVMNVSLLKATTSHLYEIAGAILLEETRSEESENMFKESLKTIWPTLLEVICRKDQSTKKLAQMIFNESQVKREDLPSDFILCYASWIKLSHFDETKHNFLRSKSKCSYEKVEALVKQCNFKELVIELQKCELFLLDESFRPIFYAERAASILHRWSRYFLTGSNGHQTEIEMGLRLSHLSNAVSIRVRKTTDVPLMTEWLSYTTGMIPLLMKQKNKPESLSEARHVCKTMLGNQKLNVYENGLLARLFYPPEVTKMYLLRRLVQINARIISSSFNTEEEGFVQEAEEQCRQLYSLANDRTRRSCGKTFVVCGKYYGAKKDYIQAIHCFNKYFELSRLPDLKQEFYTECWAVYNYARAVCCFPSSDAKIDAIERCKAVLSTNKVITIDLKRHLERILDQLECPETLPK